MQRKPWTQEQDSALKILVQEVGLTNWTLIAIKLCEKYHGFERTGKQCRQRWLNHLDIKIIKRDWTKNEENIIFEMHNKYGNKWKEIAKHLKMRYNQRLLRNQNDIKNHFYATLRKGLRRLNRILHLKIDALKVRKIKPSILSKISEYRSELGDHLKSQQINNRLFKLILKLSQEEDSNSIDCEDLLEDEELMRESEKLLKTLLKENENYIEFKLKKRIHKKQKKLAVNTLKSQSADMGIDISQYLCLGEVNEMEQARPKFQGISLKNSSSQDGNHSNSYKSEPRLRSRKI